MVNVSCRPLGVLAMEEKPPIPSKAEMEKLIEDRKNDLPKPEPTLTPSGMGEDAVKKAAFEKQQDHIKDREERISHIAEKMAEKQDMARDGFNQAKTQGMAKDAFDRSR